MINRLRLERLSAQTRKPIAVLRALHDKLNTASGKKMNTGSFGFQIQNLKHADGTPYTRDAWIFQLPPVDGKRKSATFLVSDYTKGEAKSKSREIIFLIFFNAFAKNNALPATDRNKK